MRRWLLISTLLFVPMLYAQQDPSNSAALTENRMVGGNVTVTSGQALAPTTVNCPIRMSCVTVTPTGSRALGISISGGSPGTMIPVMTKGFVFAGFNNQPVWNQTAITDSNGYAQSTSLAVQAVPITVGVLGRVSMVVNAFGNPLTCPPDVTAPFCAQVAFIGAAQTGGLVTAGSLDTATVPAYVKANQTLVQSGAVDSTGKLTLTNSDGSTILVSGSVIGPQGQPGAASTIPGPKGDTGAASTVPGPKGDTGAASTVAGPQGNPGTNGIPGANAQNPVFNFTATSLPTGATPTANVSGTYPNLSVAFGIPAGQGGANGNNGTNASNPAFTFSASALSPGSTPTANTTGTYPNLFVALGIPSGQAGGNGAPGNPGAAATVSVGTVTTGAAGSGAAVTNSGTANSAVFNFTVPQGTAGTNGSNGPANTLTIGTVNTLAAGSSATAAITGTAPNQTINLGLPTGATGAVGVASATAPIALASGVVSCPTCLTTASSYALPDLSATGTITATVLAAAGCTNAVNISVPGAVVGHRVDVMNTDGSLPPTNIYYAGSVTAANTVSVQQCATIGLSLTAKNVTVWTR